MRSSFNIYRIEPHSLSAVIDRMYLSISFDIVSNLFFKNSYVTVIVLTNEFPIQHLIFEYCPVSDCILWVGYVNNFGKVESSWLFFYWAPTPSKEYK